MYQIGIPLLWGIPGTATRNVLNPNRVRLLAPLVRYNPQSTDPPLLMHPTSTEGPEPN